MEIAPGVYVLGGSKGLEVCAFLIDDGAEGLTLIDTLFDADAKLVLRQIAACGRTVKDLKRIVLTHSHRSHLGGLALLKQQSGAGVYSHEWEADIIAGERAAQQVSWRPSMDLLNIWPYQIANNLNVSHHPPCQVDHFLTGGEELGPLQVMHTPGHSPGHLAFYSPERRVLFTGDAIVSRPRLVAGWPPLTLNPRQHDASFRRLAEFDADVLALGHGDPVLSNGARRLRSLLA